MSGVLHRVAKGMIPLVIAGAMVCAHAVRAQFTDGRGGASNTLPKEAQGVGLENHLGQRLPMNVEFMNSSDTPVKLGDYFKDGKPAIIVMAYYRCPVVCTVVLDKLSQCMQNLDYTVGKDYRTLVFSFDPSEKPAVAKTKKEHYLAGYDRSGMPGVKEGWEFHTGSEIASKELADALGFEYKKLPNGEFSHPVVVYITTPDGRISRYIGGYDYDAKDMKLHLLEATQGKIANSIGDVVMHFCYRFDPNSGKYVLVAFRVMQIGGVIAIVGMGSLIGLLFAGERIRRRKQALALSEGLAGATVVKAQPESSETSESPGLPESRTTDTHTVSRV
jgi:protein SCO1/2